MNRSMTQINIARLSRNPPSDRDFDSETVTYIAPAEVLEPTVDEPARPDGYTLRNIKTIDKICMDLIKECTAATPSILDLNLRMRFVIDIVIERCKRLNLPLYFNGAYTVEEEAVYAIQLGMMRVGGFENTLPVVFRTLVAEIEKAHNQLMAMKRTTRPGQSEPTTQPIPNMLIWLNMNDDRETPESFLRSEYTKENVISAAWTMQSYEQDRKLLLDQHSFRATLMPPDVKRQIGFKDKVIDDDDRFRSLPLPQEIRARAHVRTLGALVDALMELELTHLAQLRVLYDPQQSNTYHLYFFLLDNEKVINDIVVHSLTREQRKNM